MHKSARGGRKFEMAENRARRSARQPVISRNTRLLRLCLGKSIGGNKYRDNNTALVAQISARGCAWTIIAKVIRQLSEMRDIIWTFEKSVTSWINFFECNKEEIRILSNLEESKARKNRKLGCCCERNGKHFMDLPVKSWVMKMWQERGGGEKKGRRRKKREKKRKRQQPGASLPKL